MTETAFQDLTPPELTPQADVAPVDLTPPSEEAKPAKVKGKGKGKKAATPSAETVAVTNEPVVAAPKKSKLSALYPEDAEITVLVEGNPKKAGSRAALVFEFYRTSKTVGDFFAATAGVMVGEKKRPGDYGDITYDVGHGYIKVG